MPLPSYLTLPKAHTLIPHPTLSTLTLVGRTACHCYRYAQEVRWNNYIAEHGLRANIDFLELNACASDINPLFLTGPRSDNTPHHRHSTTATLSALRPVPHSCT